MAKELAIVCNNGSLNSAVTAALAAQKYRLVMLHVESSEASGIRPRSAYDLQTAHFKPYREAVIPLPRLTPLSTNPPGIVDLRAGSLLTTLLLELLPVLSIATKLADHYHAKAIFTGCRAGTESDELARTTEYFQIWQELLVQPCGLTDFELNNPLLELDPWQVVDVGCQVAAPFEKTWSCTETGTEPCWACRSCAAREAAFTRAGKTDPLRAVRKT